ncbi:hypothetical protein L3Q82_023871 [Scortum barcoo]|uniref:Uncharacterized protein n=1 Tax=Scortum barcoo TaxID=214431 RepID=A0ACB8WTX1_9TELE|nr:hypothetical protein L3Q82_023871 [Scortum barcoo]
MAAVAASGAPGVDEIRTGYLKALDVVRLSWLTRLCNIANIGTLLAALREYGVDSPLLRAIQSLYCRSVSLVRIAAGTLTGTCSQQLKCEAAGWDENQHLPVRGHGSQSEKGGLPTPGREGVPATSGGVLGTLFMSEGKMEREMDRRIGAASAVLRNGHQYDTIILLWQVLVTSVMNVYCLRPDNEAMKLMFLQYHFIDEEVFNSGGSASVKSAPV